MNIYLLTHALDDGGEYHEAFSLEGVVAVARREWRNAYGEDLYDPRTIAGCEADFVRKYNPEILPVLTS